MEKSPYSTTKLANSSFTFSPRTKRRKSSRDLEFVVDRSLYVFHIPIDFFLTSRSRQNVLCKGTNFELVLSNLISSCTLFTDSAGSFVTSILSPIETEFNTNLIRTAFPTTVCSFTLTTSFAYWFLRTKNTTTFSRAEVGEQTVT